MGHPTAEPTVSRVYADGTLVELLYEPSQKRTALAIRRPGGELEIASMQRGGSSADTWVLTNGEVDATSLLHYEQPAVDIAHRNRSSTSRAAPERRPSPIM